MMGAEPMPSPAARRAAVAKFRLAMQAADAEFNASVRTWMVSPNFDRFEWQERRTLAEFVHEQRVKRMHLREAAGAQLQHEMAAARADAAVAERMERAKSGQKA
jgi:hypothetical protein